MKKFFAMLLTVMLLLCCVVPMAASAASTEPAYIYFQVPTADAVAWHNFTMVYCHIWENGGDPIYGWQDKDERCEDLENGYWRYDVSALDLDPEKEYEVIFSNENGLQTYDLHVTSDCKGDIAYCGGDTCTNPMDSEKTCTVAHWMNANVHPAVQLGSDGTWINPDGIDTVISLVWGDSEGISVELPEVELADTDADADDSDGLDNAAEDANEDTLSSAPEPTLWIIIGCCVIVAAILIVVIILAKKNKKNKA